MSSLLSYLSSFADSYMPTSSSLLTLLSSFHAPTVGDAMIVTMTIVGVLILLSDVREELGRTIRPRLLRMLREDGDDEEGRNFISSSSSSTLRRRDASPSSESVSSFTNSVLQQQRDSKLTIQHQHHSHLEVPHALSHHANSFPSASSSSSSSSQPHDVAASAQPTLAIVVSTPASATMTTSASATNVARKATLAGPSSSAGAPSSHQPSSSLSSSSSSSSASSVNASATMSASAQQSAAAALALDHRRAVSQPSTSSSLSSSTSLSLPSSLPLPLIPASSSPSSLTRTLAFQPQIIVPTVSPLTSPAPSPATVGTANSSFGTSSGGRRASTSVTASASSAAGGGRQGAPSLLSPPLPASTTPAPAPTSSPIVESMNMAEYTAEVAATTRSRSRSTTANGNGVEERKSDSAGSAGGSGGGGGGGAGGGLVLRIPSMSSDSTLSTPMGVNLSRRPSTSQQQLSSSLALSRSYDPMDMYAGHGLEYPYTNMLDYPFAPALPSSLPIAPAAPLAPQISGYPLSSLTIVRSLDGHVNVEEYFNAVGTQIAWCRGNIFDTDFLYTLAQTGGLELVKFGARGRPHNRQVKLVLEGGSSSSGGKDRGKDGRPALDWGTGSIPLDEVRAIRKGKTTPVFARFPSNSDAPAHACFSLITTKRTLDLCILTPGEQESKRDLLVFGLGELTGTRLAERTEEQVLLAASSPSMSIAYVKLIDAIRATKNNANGGTGLAASKGAGDSNERSGTPATGHDNMLGLNDSNAFEYSASSSRAGARLGKDAPAMGNQYLYPYSPNGFAYGNGTAPSSPAVGNANNNAMLRSIARGTIVQSGNNAVAPSVGSGATSPNQLNINNPMMMTQPQMTPQQYQFMMQQTMQQQQYQFMMQQQAMQAQALRQRGNASIPTGQHQFHHHTHASAESIGIPPPQFTSLAGMPIQNLMTFPTSAATTTATGANAPSNTR